MSYIGDQQAWDRFVLARKGSFLQSWQWGEFQERVGRRVFRFALANENTIAQCVEMALPLGMRYWYVPRGPIIDDATTHKRTNAQTAVLLLLAEEAKKHGASFLRFDWPWQSTQDIPPMCRKVADVQPSKNWALDLTPSEEELFKGMHAKTRYNIGRAENHAQNAKTQLRIEHTKENDPEIAAQTLALLQATSARHGFRLHPRSYYEEMAKIPFVEIWRATVGEKTIAAHILAFFGSRATYIHGGSSYEHRSLMAPQLLHWEAICDAKRRGFETYDFGGIDPDRWPGLTRFKTGFGGRQESLAGTFDIPFKPIIYTLYELLRKLRK